MEVNIIIDGLKTDYSVNTIGEIYSNKFNKRNKIRYGKVKGGYNMSYLYVNGKRHDILVHRVVASAFIKNIENKQQINHKDGNKSNNSVDNLEWATQSENIKHAYDNKLMNKTYKDCWNAKLNEDEVSLIRLKLKNKEKQRSIALFFGISEQIISNIKRGSSYKNVGVA